MKKTLLYRYLVSAICIFVFCNSTRAICITTFTKDTVNIACGDSFTFGGVAYYLPVTQTDTFRGIHGCDSVVTLYLQVTDTVNIYDTICSNDSFLFNGVYVDTAGVYTAHINPPNACDSTVILTLAVKLAPVVTFTWDSLNALGVVYSGNGITASFDPCHGPKIFLLTGGYPPGGSYSGIGVSNDTFYAWQAAFIQDSIKQNYDTIGYTFLGTNQCSQSASIFITFLVCDNFGSGVHNVDSQYSLNLYPNPAHDYLTVEYNGFTTNSQIEVVDLLGRVVKTERIKGPVTNTQVDIQALSNGLYFLRIMNDSGVESEGRFSVVR